MTEISPDGCDTQDQATSPGSIVAMVLAKLCAVPDSEVDPAVRFALSHLSDHLKADMACLFLQKPNAAPILLMQHARQAFTSDDLERHTEQAARQVDGDDCAMPGIKVFSALAQGSMSRIVLTLAQPEGYQTSPQAEADIVAVLTGMAGALRRGHVHGVSSLNDRSDVADALDQGIAVFRADGVLRFINQAQKTFFEDDSGALENLAAFWRVLKLSSLDSQLDDLSYNDLPATGIETTIERTGALILQVKIRPLPRNAVLIICSDIGEIHGEKIRWQAAMEAAGVGTWEWSVAENTSKINERWAEILGYTREELGPHAPETFERLLTPESAIANRTADLRLLSGESDSFECEFQMYHKNGHLVWVLSRGRVIAYAADGTPAVISGIHLEISDLKLAEERLKQVVEGAQIGTWDWDLASNVQRTNHQWAAMLGYSDEEMTPMTYSRWRDLVHPDDIELVEQSMGLCVNGQTEATATEYRMRHKNGEWRWFLDRAKVVSRTRDGMAAFIVGIQIEIGQQKAREAALLLAKTQAEQALNERNQAERRLADIAAATDDWFWEQDSDLRFTFFSHTQFLRDDTGTGAQLLGQSWQEWRQKGTANEVGADWEAFLTTCANRQPFRDFVMELASDDGGDPRWLRFNGTPVFDETGAFTGYRGVGTDVTQLYLAKLRAEDASKSKSMFLANMSHEIRTPLNGVLGMAEVLESSVTEQRHKEMIRTIRDSGESLLSILNDILDMSKIEARKLTLEAVPFDPTELATSVEDLHRLRAEGKGLDFEISLGIGAERARIGDPHRLRQVLNNLISNAIKFTEQGRVTVVMRGKPGRPLVIEIEDTGIGMSAEQIERIHEEFVQADSSITRRYGGTGLGMSITRTLVQMMGGRMVITSEVGSGTRIMVELPLPNSELPRDAEPEAVADQQATATGLHFLIADDNATNCKVLCHLLGPFGAQITVVNNGLDAWNAWKTTDFDLLLLDIAMPVMDGIGAIGHIRADEKTGGRRYTHAVAVTANVMPFQIARYLEAGFDGFVGKPVSSKQLAQTINAILAQNAPPTPANPAGRQLLPS